jgi:16S rRNA G966 N2-methylase RsmD
MNNKDKYDNNHNCFNVLNQLPDIIIDPDDNPDNNKKDDVCDSSIDVVSNDDPSDKDSNNISNPENKKYEINVNRNIKTILRLFPYLENKEKAHKLMIDNESIYYISVREYADKITDIIKNHLTALNWDHSKSIITDATAGVGGNTISFAKHFRYVYAIELDKRRAEFLENNINVYDLKNISVITNDCMKMLPNIYDHDVIYIDPPWGGKNYKDHTDLKLDISGISIEDICNKLTDPGFMKRIPLFIVLKLPKNYDIVYFYKKSTNKNIYYYDLAKMIILVIIISDQLSS